MLTLIRPPVTLLTVCIIVHSQPHVDRAFPHLWAIFKNKLILLSALDGQKLWGEEEKKHAQHHCQQQVREKRTPSTWMCLSNFARTKSLAQGFGPVEGVALDAVLLSVDKMVTLALERHPGARVCRTFWESKTEEKKTSWRRTSIMWPNSEPFRETHCELWCFTVLWCFNVENDVPATVKVVFAQHSLRTYFKVEN